MEKLSNVMLHICFLEASKTETSFEGKPIKRRISFDLEEIGLTFDQAMELCKELVDHKTIAAWLTGGSVEKVD